MSVEQVSREKAEKVVLPEARWAALIGDSLVPLPRRRLLARVILAQAGAKEGSVLVRDYNDPVDEPIAADEWVDLAEGNVFRIVDECVNGKRGGDEQRVPKLAFFADDAWEITIEPTQSLQKLRDLWGLPDDAQIFRDLESPTDQPISTNDVVRFSDGPVFRVVITSVTVKVNRKCVRFTERRVTGLIVKKTAITQGVSIDVGGMLYRFKPDGELGPAIADDEHLVLKKCDEFRCVAPDDNS